MKRRVMKWITHQAVAVGVAFSLGLSAPGVGAAWAGAVLPDVLDQKRAALSRNRQRAFNRIHRGTTHWFGWWLAVWALGLAGAVPDLPAPWVAGLGLGGLSHVALDACTTAGVPLVPWTRRGKWSLGLCRTGGMGEYLFLALTAALFWVLERRELLALAREYGLR